MSALPVERLVLDPDEYADLRPARRRAAIELRRSRRVYAGDLVAIEFENAETLTYQAQEMLYVERVTDPGVAMSEIAVYDQLLPGPTSVTATMLLEIPGQDRVRAELDRLAGLHRAVRLEVGGHACPAHDVPPPDEGPSERTVTVHFLRFDLTPAAVAALAGGAPAHVVVDHPEYFARTELPAVTRSQLVADLGSG